MISPLALLTALPLLTLAQVPDYATVMVAGQSSGCDVQLAEGDTYYQYTLGYGNSNCYTFGSTQSGECQFCTHTADVGNSCQPCVDGQPDTISSVLYNVDQYNEGKGCFFWDQPGCAGDQVATISGQDFPDDPLCYQVSPVKRSFGCG
jgi:hypothetical protein